MAGDADRRGEGAADLAEVEAAEGKAPEGVRAPQVLGHDEDRREGGQTTGGRLAASNRPAPAPARASRPAGLTGWAGSARARRLGRTGRQPRRPGRERLWRRS